MICKFSICWETGKVQRAQKKVEAAEDISLFLMVFFLFVVSVVVSLFVRYKPYVYNGGAIDVTAPSFKPRSISIVVLEVSPVGSTVIRKVVGWFARFSSTVSCSLLCIHSL